MLFVCHILKASAILCAHFSQCTKKSQLCYCHRLHNYVCMYVCMYTPPLCRETELILGKPTRRNLCATICAIEYHKMTEKKMLIKCKHTHTYTGGTLVYLCDPCKHLFYLNNPKKIKRANRKKIRSIAARRRRCRSRSHCWRCCPAQPTRGQR